MTTTIQNKSITVTAREEWNPAANEVAAIELVKRVKATQSPDNATKIYTFAKPFYKYISGESLENHSFAWQVQTQEVTLVEKQRTNEPTSSSSGSNTTTTTTTVASNVLQAGGQNRSTGELEGEPAQNQPDSAAFRGKGMKLDSQFFPLLTEVQKVIAALESNKNFVVKLEKIQRKLHKCIIYLSKNPKWPYQETDKAIENIAQTFSQYEGIINKKHLLNENQKQFIKYISQLNKGLHQQFITLDEITLKIATKAARSSPFGIALTERIKYFIKMGVERIYFASKRQDESVVLFCRVFALHAYVYKPNADTEEARSALKNQVKRLVDLLIAYDRQYGSTTLLDFFLTLTQQIDFYFEDTKPRLPTPPPAESLVNLQEEPLPFANGEAPPAPSKKFLFEPIGFTSMVWMLETLVDCDAFIKYMQRDENQRSIDPKVLLQLSSDDRTWSAVNDLVMALGNFDLFQVMLQGRIDPSSGLFNLNQNQIDRIFIAINNELNKNDDLLTDDLKKMYLSILRMFATMNRLHLLKFYGEQTDNVSVLKGNLEKIGYDFMVTHPIPLTSLFGNATHRAITTPNFATEMSAKYTLVRLFTHHLENPVDNPGLLSNNLKEVFADFDGDLKLLCLEILGKIGETTGTTIDDHGRLVPAETWLQDRVKGLYQAIRTYAFLCQPLVWRSDNFNGATTSLGRICLNKREFYVVVQGPYGRPPFRLMNLNTGVTLDDTPDTVYVSELFDNVKRQIKGSMEKKESRDAVAHLTEAFMSFPNHDQVQEEITHLINIISGKMREEGISGTFHAHIRILANFLHAVAPFFKKMNGLIEQRFFKDTLLKRNIAATLVEEARPLRTGPDAIGPSLRDLNHDITKDENVVADLGALVSCLCVKDIQDILIRCSLGLLVGATSQLEYVICRKVDELSYVKEEFIDAFCDRHAGQNGFTRDALVAALRGLAIKKESIDKYGDILRQRPIPIHFILPNQALAVELCTSPDNAIKDKNLLIKLGTGQGKSLVIALTALSEAKKLPAKGRVFVFTSYDHLAKRDHELGQTIFRKENIKSLCISEISDLKGFESDTKIIYADVEHIESLIREIMIELLANRATSQQIDFINTIYRSGNEEVRVVLDEYDLLLWDLEAKDPFVIAIPNDLLTAEFVQRNENTWPYLSTLTKLNQNAQAAQDGAQADESSGKEYRTVNYYGLKHTPDHSGFYLLVSVMRLSKLLENAKRVIGLSGTAPQNEKQNLQNTLYFEIPSSQDPKAFGTKIQPAPNSADEAGIICRQIEKLEDFTIDADGRTLVISNQRVTEYCRSIVNDIIAVRKPTQKGSITYQRPVLIFGNPHLKYRNPGNQVEKNLWDALKKAIQDANIPLDELKKDVTDGDLQNIARSGSVTLSTIKYGRGADIRVSLDIEEGLHVIIATSVLHPRLRDQLIGRTGRMGRKGSYSAFTFGPLTKKDQTESNPHSEFYGALHHITRCFLKKTTNTATYNGNDCKKWMIFFTRCQANKKIPRQLAKDICGNGYEEDPKYSKYFE